MKKYIKSIFIMLSIIMLVSSITACSNTSAEASKNELNSSATTENTTESVETTEKETTVAENTKQKSSSSNTTTKPVEQKSEGQSKTKKVTTTQKPTTTQKQTATKNQTTTQKATTTQKPTTTKKETTTATTTAKSNKLTKSDIDWVQSQANSYIKSKGCTVNSNVDSFSGRISSKPYTNKGELLEKVKDSIDYEYQHCIDSGWDSVDMFCKIESRSDGSYFIYVMYG